MKTYQRIEIGYLGSYCRRNNLCTGMDLLQWNRMLAYADERYKEPTYFRDVAVMIKFCSETDKTFDEIENELKEVAYEIRG